MTKKEFNKKLHIIFRNCEQVIKDHPLSNEQSPDDYYDADTPEKVAKLLKERIDGILDGSKPYALFYEMHEYINVLQTYE